MQNLSFCLEIPYMIFSDFDSNPNRKRNCLRTSLRGTQRRSNPADSALFAFALRQTPIVSRFFQERPMLHIARKLTPEMYLWGAEEAEGARNTPKQKLPPNVIVVREFAVSWQARPQDTSGENLQPFTVYHIEQAVGCSAWLFHPLFLLLDSGFPDSRQCGKSSLADMMALANAADFIRFEILLFGRQNASTSRRVISSIAPISNRLLAISCAISSISLILSSHKTLFVPKAGQAVHGWLSHPGS
ncbi:MAG: hypothetical protein HGB15_08485 [Chlorobaculum sp.]|nr:hypothetical protein [Chlorobaculum sp.]